MDALGPEWALDRLAIQALAYRYASGVDRRDRQGFLSAFSPGAILRVYQPGPEGDQPVIFTGHEELGRIPDLMTRYVRTFHFVGNHLCNVRGDKATGEVYCLARHLTSGADGDTDYVMLIRYQDVYGREPGGPWLIDDRSVLVDWSELHSGILR
jgi:hypothetical protein